MIVNNVGGITQCINKGMSYTIRYKGGSQCASVMQANGKLFIDGYEAPTEEGTYKLKTCPGAILEVKKSKGFSGLGMVGVNRGVIRNNISKGEQTRQVKEKFTGNKVWDSDYTINGMHEDLTGLNIIVKGDIVLTGMNNVIVRGKENSKLGTLKINGDLIINGMNNKVETIISYGGNIVRNGMNNRVI